MKDRRDFIYVFRKPRFADVRAVQLFRIATGSKSVRRIDMTIDHEHADLSIIRFVSTGMQSPRRSVSNGIAIWKDIEVAEGAAVEVLG